MNKDKYPMYALAGLTGAGIAVWAGLPPTFLLLLICPVMMFFMMRGMGGMGGSPRGGDSTRDVPGDPDVGKRSDASKLDGSHERIDQP